MKAKKQFIACICLLVVISLSACGSAPTTIETVETATPVKATPTVQVTPTVKATATTPPTPTPEPPTPTPLPTITPTPAPTVQYNTETVSFITKDKVKLAGTFFLSQGNIAVVLAHMAGENDQQNWTPFAGQLASRGFTALTFDFRCYGQSECGGDTSGDVLSRDIGAAIGFLRDQGFERIVCMGASMGGRGCVSAAFDQDLAGMVILSGTASGDPDKQDLANFVNPAMPKLFFVSDNDPTVNRTLDMTNLYESAPEPKLFKIFPGTAHGTELFRTKHGKELRDMIFNFLEEIRSSG